MSFASLKKAILLGSLTAKLVKEVEKTNKGGGSGDDRLWKPIDKAGNGYAVVRFLLPLTVKTFLGQNCTLTPSKVLAVGTSKTP